MEIGPLQHIDLVTTETLLDLANVDGPCVTIYLPTHQYGIETRQGATMLKNLAAEARDILLEDMRRPDVEAFLEPIDELIDSPSFWQRQGAGLAIFRTTEATTVLRLPLEVEPFIGVGDSFRIAPLVPLVSGDGTFFVLALSQNEVRLFEATRHHIGELELDTDSTSLDEILSHEDREHQLQARSAGTGTTMFHGHGAGDEGDKAEVERFLNQIDKLVADRIGVANDHPLVIASVGYYLPIYQQVTNLSNVVDAVVEGNPEQLSASDLHEAAWPIAEPLLNTHSTTAVDSYHAQVGTGLASNDLETILTAAAEGRVDTLFVTPEAPDEAVWATLKTSGQLLGAPESLNGSAEPVAAIFRY